jgi:hypothetical protein
MGESRQLLGRRVSKVKVYAVWIENRSQQLRVSKPAQLDQNVLSNLIKLN